MKGGLALLVALLVAAAPASPEVLGDLARLAVAVNVEHPVDGVAVDALRERLAAFLGEFRPPRAVDAASADRLRLTVSVRPYSSSTLRGYALPFSGTYGIGTVRLSVERAVHLLGRTARSIPAIVWQRERLVATRWDGAGAAVTGAVRELLDDLRGATLAER